jgi:hypothetical protein
MSHVFQEAKDVPRDHLRRAYCRLCSLPETHTGHRTPDHAVDPEVYAQAARETEDRRLGERP